MTDIWEQFEYKGIARACFVIALCNGGINKERSDKKWAKDYVEWFARQDFDFTLIDKIDKWLESLDADEMEIVCDGEYNSRQAILINAPVYTDIFLEDYFNTVC